MTGGRRTLRGRRRLERVEFFAKFIRTRKKVPVPPTFQ
jgi:hypothetical protein